MLWALLIPFVAVYCGVWALTLYGWWLEDHARERERDWRDVRWQ